MENRRVIQLGVLVVGGQRVGRGYPEANAVLTNANLSLGQFQSADFTQANLFHATTNGANFTGAKFSNTIMPDGSVR